MTFTINKAVPADFPALSEPIPDGGALQDAVNAQISSAVCQYVNVGVTGCDLVHDVEPSAGDKTTIDSIVAAHTGQVPSILAVMEACFMDGRSWGEAAADDSNNNMRTSGMYDESMSDTTSAAGLDSDGRYLQQNSAASVDSKASGDLLALSHRRELNCEVMLKFKLLQTTVERFFACVCDSTSFGAHILSADVPNREYVGVRYSTGAGDTTFHFMSCDGAGNTNDVDSGIAIDTEAWFVHIKADDSGPSWTVRILDNDFLERASHTFTTNMPGASTDMALGVGVRTLEAVIKSIRQYFWRGVNKR